MPQLLVGLFVGGKSRRMGGFPKGALRAPGSELGLLERLVAETRAALPAAEVVLVGEAPHYSALGLVTLADAPAEVGPLGGLNALLLHASQRRLRWALALACDLPYLDRRLIARLGSEQAETDVVLVQQGAWRNPLIARYGVEPSLAACADVLRAGRRSLQAVLDRLEPRVARLPLTTHEAALLDDWDTLTDVERSGGKPPVDGGG